MVVASIQFAKIRFNRIHPPKEDPQCKFRAPPHLGLPCRKRLVTQEECWFLRQLAGQGEQELGMPVKFLGRFIVLFLKHQFLGSRFSYHDFPFCFYIFLANEVTGDIQLLQTSCQALKCFLIAEIFGSRVGFIAMVNTS